MTNKAPSFQFYPADWRKDPALRACSIEARGLWIDLLCIMHETEPRGFLAVTRYGMVQNNGDFSEKNHEKNEGCPEKISEKSLSNMVGIGIAKFKKLFQELLANGVVSQDERGIYFSRRMKRDAELSAIRKAAGKLGGNPGLVGNLVKQNAPNLDNQTSNQNPTPSSSSSSSSSENPLPPPEKNNQIDEFEAALAAPPPPPDSWQDESRTMTTTTAEFFDGIQRRIQAIRGAWKRPFTRIELEAIYANARALAAVTAAEWDLLGRFFRVDEIPEEYGKFWRPDGRTRFVEQINDILIGARRFATECRKRGIEFWSEPQPTTIP